MHVSCPGWCCAVIHQPGTLAQLRDAAPILLDGPMVLDMIEPVSYADAVRRRRRHGAGTADLEDAQEGRLYACRHWDETTRLCSVYDRRPAMCRDYPYNEPCQHCGLVMGITQDDRVELVRSRRKALQRAAVDVSA